ncbi:MULTISPECIES: hypothetical protein [Leuconostoc]|uniref:hypothetical protein n=1 Tax=Leuconostoc TaxID=1243 RepID=UPI00056BD19D|nr:MULTISPECIES: hypothetical protein [Leuconostoc]OQJ69849.1 hypothetical protein BMS80_09960 [Leuconostoc pseudomesenteroides]MDG9744230.1 hypothetical protein [Leuconostoc falkenbergense]ORI50428.1 hypothetical protein BMS85_09090 [Leuconostoc pseudomesenteroides]ORI57968.1 hypothetical protein BMS88_07995 [Leuconostoc pseudomesenteroides]ORI73205.1 hypothetical protein BMS65_08095 [Leuconostoc pseudomesenteroides]
MEKEAPSSAGARLVALEKGITCRCVFVADCALNNVQSFDQIRQPPKLLIGGVNFQKSQQATSPHSYGALIYSDLKPVCKFDFKLKNDVKKSF